MVLEYIKTYRSKKTKTSLKLKRFAIGCIPDKYLKKFSKLQNLKKDSSLNLER